MRTHHCSGLATAICIASLVWAAVQGRPAGSIAALGVITALEAFAFGMLSQPARRRRRQRQPRPYVPAFVAHPAATRAPAVAQSRVLRPGTRTPELAGQR